MAGKKKIFPGKSGKYPGKGGKKPRKKTWTIVLGTVVVTIGFHSANFKQVSVMPGPPSIICTLHASTTMHWYTSYHKKTAFFPAKGFLLVSR
jgi:hypothetical protein